MGNGGRFEKAEWDRAKEVLHLRCFFNTQVERSSRHLSMSLEFGKENHLLKELKIACPCHIVFTYYVMSSKDTIPFM